MQRLVPLAEQAAQKLERLLFAGSSGKAAFSAAAAKWRAVFRTPLRDFDALVLLRKEALPQAGRGLPPDFPEVLAGRDAWSDTQADDPEPPPKKARTCLLTYRTFHCFHVASLSCHLIGRPMVAYVPCGNIGKAGTPRPAGPCRAAVLPRGAGGQERRKAAGAGAAHRWVAPPGCCTAAELLSVIVAAPCYSLPRKLCPSSCDYRWAQTRFLHRQYKHALS